MLAEAFFLSQSKTGNIRLFGMPPPGK